MALYCVDASFVVDELLQTNPAVIARWRAFSPADILIAPALLRAECTSVLSEHAYRTQNRGARLQVGRMLSLPVRIVETPTLYPRSFDLARALGWAKAYDALYLAVAELEGAELITVDKGMHGAATRLGIPATLVQ